MQVSKIMLFFLALSIPGVGYTANDFVLDQENTTFLETSQMPIPIMEKLLFAEIALDRRDPITALTYYIDAAQETQDAQIAKRATNLALLFGSFETAIVPARIWAEQSSEDLQAQATIATLYLSQLKGLKAVPYLERLQEVDPLHVAHHFQLLYDELKSPEEKAQVVDALSVLMEKKPDRSGAYLTLSNIFLMNNAPEAALIITGKALDRGFTDSLLPVLHAESLHRLSRKEEALNFLSNRLAEKPDDVELKLYYAEVLLKIWNNPDKARLQIIGLQDEPMESHQLLSAVILSIENAWFDEATHFLNTLKSDPKEADTAEYFLGRVAEFQGNIEQAVSWYDIVDAGQYQAVAHLRAATLLSQDNELDKALVLIQEARPLTPEDVKLVALIELEILSKMKLFNDAFGTLSDALAQLPFDTDLLYIRALLAEKLDNLNIAEQDFRKIIRLFPNHIDALNALGYMLANKTDRLVEAMALIQKAYELSPKNAGVLDSLGWAYFKMGEIEKAQDYLEKAYSLNNQALIAAHLGEVLHVQGKNEEATTIWSQALKKWPKDEFLLEAVNRLMPERFTAQNTLDIEE